MITTRLVCVWFLFVTVLGSGRADEVVPVRLPDTYTPTGGAAVSFKPGAILDLALLGPRIEDNHTCIITETKGNTFSGLVRLEYSLNVPARNLARKDAFSELEGTLVGNDLTLTARRYDLKAGKMVEEWSAAGTIEGRFQFISMKGGDPAVPTDNKSSRRGSLFLRPVGVISEAETAQVVKSNKAALAAGAKQWAAVKDSYDKINKSKYCFLIRRNVLDDGRPCVEWRADQEFFSHTSKRDAEELFDHLKRFPYLDLGLQYYRRNPVITPLIAGLKRAGVVELRQPGKQAFELLTQFESIEVLKIDDTNQDDCRLAGSLANVRALWLQFPYYPNLGAPTSVFAAPLFEGPLKKGLKGLRVNGLEVVNYSKFLGEFPNLEVADLSGCNVMDYPESDKTFRPAAPLRRVFLNAVTKQEFEAFLNAGVRQLRIDSTLGATSADLDKIKLPPTLASLTTPLWCPYDQRAFFPDRKDLDPDLVACVETIRTGLALRTAIRYAENEREALQRQRMRALVSGLRVPFLKNAVREIDDILGEVGDDIHKAEAALPKLSAVADERIAALEKKGKLTEKQKSLLRSVP